MSDPDLDALAELVGPLDVFARDHWGRAPLLRRVATPQPLLSLADVESLVAGGLRRPTFRLVQDGRPLPADRATRAVRLGGARLEDVADPERVADAVATGATLVLQGLQRTWGPLRALCAALERATSHPCQANAYLTPAGSAGLARHQDDHHVLVVQQHGRKHWKVDGLGDLVLAPGDVLYLPAGTPHAAEAAEESSLHLTVGLLAVTAGAVVRRALTAADGFDGDRPLPLGYARPEGEVALRTAMAEILRAAGAALGSLSPDERAAAEAERARTRRPPDPSGRLADVVHAPLLTADDVVVRRGDRRADVRPDPEDADQVVVVLDDRRLRLPAVGRAAVERLLDGEPVRVGDLPGVDLESRVVLARRLLRDGALRRA